MRIIKEVLRLNYQANLSQRQISKSLNISLGSVSLYLSRAKKAGLNDWPLPDSMGDTALETALFPKPPSNAHAAYVVPDYAEMHQELKRKGVTKQLLWEEYKQIHGDNGYQYSQYCQRYRHWVQQQKCSMRQIHKAGEKLFIDYCGPTVPIINPDTGEVRNAQIFVATWGASNYTYAHARASQKKADWIESHVKAFQFFGGVPDIIVPDQLKSAVTQSCRYEPVINESYQHMAAHYQCAIIPARPRKPKDKAKVENAVLVVERWILARLRHLEFFSLAQLNQAIAALLKDLNQRPFKALPGTRASQFELLDKPAMNPLPSEPYQFVEFKLVRVNIDYHIDFEQHFYSVPYHLVKQRLEAQVTCDSVALFFNHKQVARHPRSTQKYGYTTHLSHLPESHRKHQQWTPERILTWAQSIGPSTLLMTEDLFNRKPHPEQAYRACLGLLNLSRRYDSGRLEGACQRAIEIKSLSLKSVQSILKQGLDRLDLAPNSTHDETPISSSVHHDNIRGADYYDPTP